MWTGQYVRSPLARALIMNMVSETDSAGHEAQKVSEQASERARDASGVYLVMRTVVFYLVMHYVQTW